MRAVIYCRVSTKEQTENLSLPTQRRACVEYCERNGFAVDHVFVEGGESAKTADRKELQRLLAYCREKRGQIQFLVVYRVDRFARDRFDHFQIRAYLHKLGITLRSVTEPIDDTSFGRLTETMLAGWAQFDNDVRAERTKAGMEATLEARRWPFGVPLGYVRIGGRGSSIQPDRHRAPLVRQAFEMLATGVHSERAVLRHVTELGLRTLREKPVSPQTFRQIVRNPLYTGLMRVKGWNSNFKGDFESIITEELFSSVQAVLEGKRPNTKTYSHNHEDFPLRRFVRCAECNTPLTASWSRGRNQRYGYYRCFKPTCRAINVRKEQVEPAFIEFLQWLTPKPDYLRLFREITLDVWNETRRQATKQRRMLQGRLNDLNLRKDRIVEAFVQARSIDQQTYERQVTKLDEEIALAEMASHDARIEEIDVEGLVAFAEHVLGNAARLWIESSLDQRQRLQRVLFPHGVTYSRDGIFGTAETSMIFRLLQALPTEKGREASPTGFEPVSPA